MPWLGAVIGGVQGTVGQIMGAEAAGQQEEAAQRALEDIQGNLRREKERQNQIQLQQQGLYTNALAAGNSALQGAYGQGLSALQGGYQQGVGSFNQGAGALNQLASMGPYSAAQAQSGGHLERLMADPTAFQADPGYQFRLQQGQDAINASASAMGGRASGRALKELSSFNQNLASQEFNNAFQRASAADQQMLQQNQFNAMAQNQAMSQAMGLNAQGLQGLGSLYQNLGQFQAQGGAAQANQMAQLGQLLNQNQFGTASAQAQALGQYSQNRMAMLDMNNMAIGGRVGYSGQGLQAAADAEMAKAGMWAGAAPAMGKAFNGGGAA